MHMRRRDRPLPQKADLPAPPRRPRPASAAVELARGATERYHQPARGLDPHTALPAAALSGFVAELSVEVDLLHVQIVRDLCSREAGVALLLALEERPDALGRDH